MGAWYLDLKNMHACNCICTRHTFVYLYLVGYWNLVVYTTTCKMVANVDEKIYTTYSIFTWSALTARRKFPIISSRSHFVLTHAIEIDAA